MYWLNNDGTAALFSSQDDNITANPGFYGLTNTTQPCIQPLQEPFRCENPAEYVYWDNIHPTAAVHRILGNAVVEAWTNSQ